MRISAREIAVVGIVQQSRRGKFDSMRIFLIHIRDPQFYALPAATRAENGNIRVMGFPPIGIMSLSAVLKRAGHECVMFDQANPETPNEVIIEEIQQAAARSRWLEFPQHDQLSLRQDSGPSDPRRGRTRDAGLRRRVRHVLTPSWSNTSVRRWISSAAATASSSILDLLERLDDPGSVAGLTWAKDGQVVNNPNRPAGAQSGSVAVSRPREPAAGFRRIDAARRAGGPVHGALHHHADLARLSVAVRVLRHPDLQRRQVALAQPAARRRRSSSTCRNWAMARCISSTTIFSCSPSASRRSAKGSTTAGITIQWGCEGRVDSVAQHLFPAMAKAHCRTLMFGIESGSQKMLDRLEERADAGGGRDGGDQCQEGRHRDRPRLFRRRQSGRNCRGYARDF